MPGLFARPIVRASIAAALLATAPGTAATGIEAPERALSREVFGFFSPSARDYMLDVADYSVLSTVAFFGLDALASGHLQTTRTNGSPTAEWTAWTSQWMDDVIVKAHGHGTDVVLTVRRFAWSDADRAATVALLETASARSSLAAEIAETVTARGVDGVNLDFEPMPDGVGDEFVAFVRELRAELDLRQPGLQLTFDVTANPTNYDIAALTAPGAANAVFIMGYPYHGSWSANAGATSPLSGLPYDLTDTVDRFLTLTSADKVILGLPYYGYEWSTQTRYRHSPTRPPGPTYGSPSSRRISAAIELGRLHGVRWDVEQQVPWTRWRYKACAGCPFTWRQLYYENRRSLGLKYDLINDRDLAGVGFWALGFEGDRPGLYRLLREKFGAP
jgi:spore germination protein YaaH